MNNLCTVSNLSLGHQTHMNLVSEMLGITGLFGRWARENVIDYLTDCLRAILEHCILCISGELRPILGI